MLFMVIERFKDIDLLRERFHRHGRMLPEGVVYQGSWMDKDGSRCFQIMDASDLASLMGWVRRWEDLVDFEIVQVLTSQDYWSLKGQSR
jgi:hypothetical protein